MVLALMPFFSLPAKEQQIMSLTHPRAATYVIDAAAMQGSAAAKRDALNIGPTVATIIQLTHLFLPQWKHMVTWGSP